MSSDRCFVLRTTQNVSSLLALAALLVERHFLVEVDIVCEHKHLLDWVSACTHISGNRTNVIRCLNVAALAVVWSARAKLAPAKCKCQVLISSFEANLRTQSRLHMKSSCVGVISDEAAVENTNPWV